MDWQGCTAIRYLPMGLISFLLICLLSPAVQAAEMVSVKWVDDGDTILLADGRRVRYIGINAPEVAHPEKGQAAEPFGEAAYEAEQISSAWSSGTSRFRS